MKSRRLEKGPRTSDRFRVRIRWWLGMVSLTFSLGSHAAFRAEGSTSSNAELEDPSQSLVQEFRLEDPIQRLDPRKNRLPADLDRLQARSLFAHGRVLFQRKQRGAALRSFQRAFRLEEAHEFILDQIVPLAIELDQAPVAARYAALADSSSNLDAALLRQLAIYLTERREFDSAIKLYELALEKDSNEKDPSRVLVRHEMGRLHFLQRRFGPSAECFSIVGDALDHPDRFGLDDQVKKMLLGDDGTTYAIMAESFFKAKRFDRAEDFFRKADRRQPNKELLAFHLARIEEQRGHRDKSLQQLEIYLQSGLAIAGAEPYELLERLLRDQPDFDKESLQDKLEGFYKLQPENFALAYHLGDYYKKNEQWASSRSLFERLVERAPSVDAYVALLRILRHEKQDDALIEVLAQVVQRSGDVQAVQEFLNEMVTDVSGVARLLESAENRIRQIPPGTTRSNLAFAACFLALGANQDEKADKFFRQATESTDIQSKLARTLNWALQLLLRERIDESVRVLRQGLELEAPDTTKALFHYYLAGAFVVSNQFDKALHAAQQAARLNPDSTTFQSRKAWVLFSANRRAEAEFEYKNLISQFENDFSDDARQTLKEAKSSLSAICVATKRIDEAEEWLEQLLDEYPIDAGASNDLAYLWADQNKNMHRVLPMVERAVKAQPDNPAFLDSLGWALYRLERIDDSVVHLKKAAATEQPDGIILDHLGDAYYKQTNLDLARSSWQRAIQALSADTEAERIASIQQKIESLKSE